MAKKKKIPKISNDVKGNKTPMSKENAESYLNKSPSWRFAKNSFHEFEKWKILNKDKNQINFIINTLMSFEGMSWNQIMNTTGGRRKGTNHHMINKNELCSEALRLNGTKRLFGQIENGIFIVHWYDENHEICPSLKRNT